MHILIGLLMLFVYSILSACDGDMVPIKKAGEYMIYLVFIILVIAFLAATGWAGMVAILVIGLLIAAIQSMD